jgi:hypothetical protein
MTPGILGRRPALLLIFGSFFAFTLPLAGLHLAGSSWLPRLRLELLFFILLGNTHFCLTLFLYGRTLNLEHFGRSRLNRAVYFGAPLGIFLAFVLLRVFALGAAFPSLDRALAVAVRILNFHHWGRQSFGMVQLFRAQSGAKYPAWLRPCESTLFTLLPLGMTLTYLAGGKIKLGEPWTAGLLAVCAALLVACLAGLNRARAGPPGVRAALIPSAYLLLQTASSSLAVYATSFYILAQAMHYVEYHVVMYPRLFGPKALDRGVDRFFGVFQREKALFYACLLLLSAASILMMSSAGRPWSPGAAAVLSLFDGLFVFHFFVEGFVWRMGDPYYRRTVLPLLARPRAAAEPAEAAYG